MKKLPIILFVINCCCFVQTSAQTIVNLEEQEVLQTIIELVSLEELWEKNAEGKFLPLVIQTNEKCSDQLPLRHFGQPVSLQNASGQQDLVLDLYRLEINTNKAVVKFSYHGTKVTVRMSKLDEVWVARSTYLRGKGEFNYSFEI